MSISTPKVNSVYESRKYTELTTSSRRPNRDVPTDPLIGPLLRLPLQAIRARMLVEVAAAGYDDIGPAYFNILQAPTPEGMRPTELAARGQMSKQAANKLIRHLERRGYVELEPDPADRRARVVRLTERGRRLIATIRETVEQVEREWAAQLGERRFAELRATLKELSGLE
jgi:DNA-binding MarR family transcriptional regulator